MSGPKYADSISIQNKEDSFFVPISYGTKIGSKYLLTDIILHKFSNRKSRYLFFINFNSFHFRYLCAWSGWMEFTWINADAVSALLLQSYQLLASQSLIHYSSYFFPYFQCITDNSSIFFIYGVLFTKYSFFLN